MSEEKTQNETQKQEPLENQPAVVAAPANDGRDQQNRFAEMERKYNDAIGKLSERDKADKEAVEAKAKEDGELQKIIDARDLELAESKADVESQKTKNAMIQFDSKLLSLGIQNEFTRDGIVSKIMSQEPDARDAFIADLQKNHPELFQAPSKSYGTGSIGTVSQGSQNGMDWNGIQKVLDNRQSPHSLVKKTNDSIRDFVSKGGTIPPHIKI